MGKRMKSELWDNMQRFMAMYNDHMVHYYNKTDGEFDIDVLKLAIGKAVDIAPNTLTKMRKDGEVSMSVLLKIATYLDCDISEICEFVKDEE